MDVSQDPINGANQKSAAFWKEVETRYNADFTPTRTERALNGKWAEIQRDTQFFIGFFSQVTREDPSGTGEEDRIKKALEYYSVSECSRNKKGTWFLL